MTFLQQHSVEWFEGLDRLTGGLDQSLPESFQLVDCRIDSVLGFHEQTLAVSLVRVVTSFNSLGSG